MCACVFFQKQKKKRKKKFELDKKRSTFKYFLSFKFRIVSENSFEEQGS